MVFDTAELNSDTQTITHYGIRWHKKEKNTAGEEYKVSYELSNAFLFPCINATTIEVEMQSVQSKKQITLIKILSCNDETKLFTERKFFSKPLNPGERTRVTIPFVFERNKLYRIDFITATERINDRDDGVAVYSAALKK
jgi:hypothetical protein